MARFEAAVPLDPTYTGQPTAVTARDALNALRESGPGLAALLRLRGAAVPAPGPPAPASPVPTPARTALTELRGSTTSVPPVSDQPQSSQLAIPGELATPSAAPPPPIPTPPPGGTTAAPRGPTPEPTPAPTPVPVSPPRLPTPAVGEAIAAREPEQNQYQEAAQRTLQQFSQGLSQGGTQTFDFFQDIADQINTRLGLPKTERGIFHVLGDLVRLPTEQLQEPANLQELITERLAQAVTGDLPKLALATHGAGPVLGFGGLAALERALRGGTLPEIVGDALTAAAQGGIFKGLGVLTRPARVAGSAGLGALSAATAGAPTQDVIASGATVGLLSTLGRGGVNVRQALADLRRYGGLRDVPQAETVAVPGEVKGPETVTPPEPPAPQAPPPGPQGTAPETVAPEFAPAAPEAPRVGRRVRAASTAAYEPEPTAEASGAPPQGGPASTFGGPQPSTPQQRADLVKRSAIVKELSDKLGVPIRVGRLGQVRRSVLGFFKIQPEVIRSRLANDIRTISHEIGHYLDKTIFGGGTIKGSTFRQFKDELDPIATKPRAGQSATPEGFAEFVALYITDPARANVVAPRTYQFFDHALETTHPEVRDVLLKARTDYARWQQQPATAKILSQLSINEKPHKGITRNDVVTAAVDDLHAFRDFVEKVAGPERRGRFFARIPFSNAPALENAEVVARTSRAWMGKADSFLKSGRGAIDFHTLKVVGPPLEDILRPVNDQLDNWRVYSIARRTMERSAQGGETGISRADAAASLQELDSQVMRDTFDAVRQWRGHLRRYLRDSGVLAPEALDAMERIHEDYVPLYRVADDEVAGSGGTGATFANLFNPIQRLSKAGSARDIVDPIESDIKNAYAFVNVAERNLVGQALVKLAGRHDGAGKFVERIPTPLRPVQITRTEFERMLAKYAQIAVSRETRETLGATTETSTTTGTGAGGAADPRSVQLVEGKVREALTARGFSAGEADQYINRLRGAQTPEARQTIIRQVQEKIRTTEIKESIQFDAPEKIVDIFRPSSTIPRDAPIIGVYFKGRRILYQVSPPLREAMLNLNREQSSALVRALSIPGRMLRLGATTLSPEFAARNPIRDQFTAFTQSRYGYSPVNFIQGLFHMLRQDDVYQEFVRSGGLHAALVSMDRDYLQQSVRDLTGQRSSGLSNVIRHPIETLRLISELSEEPTRIGEFLRAKAVEGRKVGGRELLTRIGFAGREVSVDFNRMGSKVKALNQLIAFFNPSIQGVNRAYRAFQERPLGMTAKVVASITIPSLLLYWANHDDARVQDLPQWQRDLFFIVPQGHVTRQEWQAMTAEQQADFSRAHPIWRIPKPFELGVLFGSLPERIIDSIQQRSARPLAKWLPSALGALLPSAIPTFALALVENYGNWSFFTDRPIVPRGKEDLEPALQKSGYTSELATKIGGAINYSPAKVENLIRGYTGGGGILALNGIDAVFRMARTIGAPEPARPAPSLADMPGVRGFVVRYPTANVESIQEFYTLYGASQRALKSFDAYKRSGDVAGAKQYLEQHRLELALSAPLTAVAKGLAQYRQVQDRLYEEPTLDAAEKRRAIDATTLQMIALSHRALDQVHAWQEEHGK